MRWFNSFRSQEESGSEPSLEDKAAQIESEAMDKIKEGIDLVNEAMLILQPLRYSVWLDRSQRPARLVLCDWEDCAPRVIHGEE